MTHNHTIQEYSPTTSGTTAGCLYIANQAKVNWNSNHVRAVQYTGSTQGANDSNTSYNGSSTDKEARGMNMTIRVWKRTS